MYIMLGLIFNIKRRRASFFVLVPTRPAVLADTPLFCRLRMLVIKTAAGFRLPLYTAYSPKNNKDNWIEMGFYPSQENAADAETRTET